MVCEYTGALLASLQNSRNEVNITFRSANYKIRFNLKTFHSYIVTSKLYKLWHILCEQWTKMCAYRPLGPPFPFPFPQATDNTIKIAMNYS